MIITAVPIPAKQIRRGDLIAPGYRKKYRKVTAVYRLGGLCLVHYGPLVLAYPRDRVVLRGMVR